VEGGARGLRPQGVACEGVTVFSNEIQEKELEKKIRDPEQLMGMKEVDPHSAPPSLQEVISPSPQQAHRGLMMGGQV
jgi:hypothetical protein